MLWLADEQDARTGDSDQAEGDHREGERPEGLREGAAQYRPDDEPRPEDDRVDAERGPGHGVLDDVTEVGEGRGRERPGAGREDGDQRPSGDELLTVKLYLSVELPKISICLVVTAPVLTTIRPPGRTIGDWALPDTCNTFSTYCGELAASGELMRINP